MNIKQLVVIAFSSAMLASCGGDTSPKDEAAKHVDKVKTEVIEATPAKVDPLKDKGVGPISSITLGEIDPALAEEGKKIFKDNCKVCHKIKKRYIGPSLAGVTERRTPEWIMNMIMDPKGMVANNALAKELLAEYSAPMANQNMTEDQARAILEYFRTHK